MVQLAEKAKNPGNKTITSGFSELTYGAAATIKAFIARSGSAMARRQMVFVMPAPATAAFEAFHNHGKRLEWDTLLSKAEVEGGGTYPYVGAVTLNVGRGALRGPGMRTRFVSYESPRLAAATIVEPSGLFAYWGASMRHRDLPDGTSELIYTFNLKLRPRLLGLLFDPLAARIFAHETRRRFTAMAAWLEANQATKRG
ncbi:SRPBCC family protein [Paraburkholderia megapolitana]|nr:SRPBCC family protein [Paraburkholderia megapolitana]